ncbi:xanthine dehydrogenase family protein molybdopterin-binding subunit [Oligoflexus tunisiensis]|uniref:xanthine dehydrogenase family protein molybdopterin-binding subunit n=1 Tax=Oligoflexus tunisiensis TaxID=708132 RepID=UPI000A5E40E8|nr:molybdopterin cofactor-binding domain-containing protein [Oligoflexus tunisiensis]
MLNVKSTRRELITRSLGGTLSLVFGFSLPWVGREAAHGASPNSIILNTFIRIFADNQVEITVVKAEMGQGVITSLAMLIAEELDADWSQVTVKLEGEMGAFVDPQSPFAGTFGSTSVRSNYLRLRKIGAAVRQVLLQAAAAQTGHQVHELQGNASWVVDAAGQKLVSYGQLIQAAAQLPLPSDPPLKHEDQFRIVGQRQHRKDAALKIEGQPIYGMDVRLPGMQYGAVRQHRVFGSRLLNFPELQGQMPAGYQLVEVPGAIIAIGPSYWRAQRILDQLAPRYETTAVMDSNSQPAIEQRLSEAVQNFNGPSVFKHGDGSGALALCETVVDAEYHTPFLAHGALEPLNCTAWVEGDRCEFWIPTQSPQLAAYGAARALKRPPHMIKVNVTYLGGGFGRKVESDYVVHAALASQAVQGPVQVIWSRSEDTQHDYYRPAYQARLKAGIRGEHLAVWTGKNAGPSIAKRNNPNSTQIDFSSIDGFADIPYGIDHQEVFHEEVDLSVPVGYWRSVGKSQNTFFVESFMDEIAARMQIDPLQLRRIHLNAHPRAQRLLDTLAEICDWNSQPTLGMGFTEGFGSLAAMAAQVSLVSNTVKVERLWTVVDCGPVVNPEGAEAQVQGAALYGLAAALFGKVTVTGGKVDQTIFADRPFIKLAEAPVQEVHFVRSQEAIGGLGELATPLAAPAVTNALYRLTGQRIRRLPINDFSWT